MNNKKYAVLCFIIGFTIAPLAGADTLTVSDYHPPSHHFAVHGVKPWMDCVSEKAGDSIEFRYFPSGQVASGKESLDAVNNGLVDLGPVPIGYVTNKLPLSGMSMLPNMASTATQAVNAFREMFDSGEIIADELAHNQVQPIFINMMPPYQVNSRVGPIKDLDDFSGKVIRSGGGTMNLVIRELGGAPADISGGDMYVAMERSTVDGTIMALASLKPYNMPELVNAISINGNFGTFPTLFVMDRGKYLKLSDKDKAIIDECGREVEQNYAHYLDDQNTALAKEFSGMGIDVYRFSEKELAEIESRLSVVANDYIQRLSNRGLPAEQVYQAYRQALDKTGE